MGDESFPVDNDRPSKQFRSAFPTITALILWSVAKLVLTTWTPTPRRHRRLPGRLHHSRKFDIEWIQPVCERMCRAARHDAERSTVCVRAVSVSRKPAARSPIRIRSIFTKYRRPNNDEKSSVRLHQACIKVVATTRYPHRFAGCLRPRPHHRVINVAWPLYGGIRHIKSPAQREHTGLHPVPQHLIELTSTGSASGEEYDERIKALEAADNFR